MSKVLLQGIAAKKRESREEGIPVVSCQRTTCLPALPSHSIAVESTGNGDDSRE